MAHNQYMSGPLARIVADLTFASRNMVNLTLAARPLGGEVLMPILRREPNLPQKLKIGWWVEEAAFKVSQMAELWKGRSC